MESFKKLNYYVDLVDYLNNQIKQSLITDETIIKYVNDINDYNSKTKNQQFYIRNKEKFKKYYEENKDAIKEKSRERYNNNKNKLVENNDCDNIDCIGKTKNQQYYIRNKERFKKYYEENKDIIKEKSRKRYMDNKNKLVENNENN